MLDALIALCTSRTGLYWLVVASDLSIAAAYFAIPATMAIVFRHRKTDIPYPWLWILFVTFIVACGLTHLTHVLAAASGAENLATQAAVEAFCALTSVGTAIAFAIVLPQIKMLPSPQRLRTELEKAVALRTREKDRLLRELHHRVGNQIQVLSSLVSIESRRAEQSETLAALARIRSELDRMAADHVRRSRADYLGEIETAAAEPMSPVVAPAA